MFSIMKCYSGLFPSPSARKSYGLGQIANILGLFLDLADLLDKKGLGCGVLNNSAESTTLLKFEMDEIYSYTSRFIDQQDSP